MGMTVLHIPHVATAIPPDARAGILLEDASLAGELLRMTDWFTDELFELDGATRVVHPVSRLVVDPERFEDDALESMAARGMGVIYTRTSEGQPLREPPDAAARGQLIDAWYRPHHAALADAVDASLQRHGQALVLDCHSFASVPLPHEPDQSSDRPAICIGTDPFHTPQWLAAAAMHAFEREGFSVALDMPFAGALVPTAHHRRDPRVLALMIEVNRGLYMDERSGDRHAAFEVVRRRIQAVVGGIDRLASERPERERLGRAAPSRPLESAFVATCRLAARRHWCWKMFCTTCGCTHFRYALLELAMGRHPDLPGWQTRARDLRHVRDTLAPHPRGFDLGQQRRIAAILANAPLEQLCDIGPPTSWLGYMGLALHFTEDAEALDRTLTNAWRPQLDALVQGMKGEPPCLGADGEQLRWEHLRHYASRLQAH